VYAELASTTLRGLQLLIEIVHEGEATYTSDIARGNRCRVQMANITRAVARLQCETTHK
jgi:hypothetical protein